MNINKIDKEIRRINNESDPLYGGVNFSEDCVDYGTAAWLFDMGFNEPCDTYFHNEDDNAGYPEGSPERDQWECREDNWEICGYGKFINYPDNFIIRHRYARPTYIQVLRWFENYFQADIDITSAKITVKNLNIHNCKNGQHFVDSFTYYMGDACPSNFKDLSKIAVEIIMKKIIIMQHIADIDIDTLDFNLK